MRFLKNLKILIGKRHSIQFKKINSKRFIANHNSCIRRSVYDLKIHSFLESDVLWELYHNDNSTHQNHRNRRDYHHNLVTPKYSLRAHPACRKRQLLGTQWQFALLVEGLPVSNLHSLLVRNGLPLFPIAYFNLIFGMNLENRFMPTSIPRKRRSKHNKQLLALTNE